MRLEKLTISREPKCSDMMCHKTQEGKGGLECGSFTFQTKGEE